jgi:hypothetical protein
VKLGDYIDPKNPEWQEVIQKAFQKNGWFIPEFINYACEQLRQNFLDRQKLEEWVDHYHIDDNIDPKNIGIVMAGNIPLVGFHDFLCCFISGHRQTIKLSTKDDVLLKEIVRFLYSLDIEIQNSISFAEMLKGADAFIATGSNNTGRYFEQYFGKYPNIIRRNRTSVAILTGDETESELEGLSDDVNLYFGFGCRNVTKIYVPSNYDFIPLLNSFNKYLYFADHHKYKNNYDYQLSIVLLNNIMYMTNGSVLLTENKQYFSPVSQLHYEVYETNPADKLQGNEELQCIVSRSEIPFGETQKPGLYSYADGVDTMAFLLSV